MNLQKYKDRIEQELLIRKKELEKHDQTLQELLQDEKRYSDHLADMALRDQERVLLAAHTERVMRQIHELEEALRRISQGTYGLCEHCGQPIEEERLDLLPAARYCANCAQNLRA